MHVHVGFVKSPDQAFGEIGHNDHKGSRVYVLVKHGFGRNTFPEEMSF